jgi:hypothetical protein
MAKAVSPAGKQARRVARKAASGLTRSALAEAASRLAQKTAASPAALVAKQLPGWKLVGEAVQPLQSMEDIVMKNETGPSLAQLRNKFLGAGLMDGPSDNAPLLGHTDESVQTVQVQRKRGGAVKTADIKKGKVQIVQG